MFNNLADRKGKCLQRAILWENKEEKKRGSTTIFFSLVNFCCWNSGYLREEEGVSPSSADKSVSNFSSQGKHRGAFSFAPIKVDYRIIYKL